MAQAVISPDAEAAVRLARVGAPEEGYGFTVRMHLLMIAVRHYYWQKAAQAGAAMFSPLSAGGRKGHSWQDMLSIKQTKKLIGDPNATDEQAQEVRDACYQLAAFIYDEWVVEQTGAARQIPPPPLPCRNLDSR